MRSEKYEVMTEEFDLDEYLKQLSEAAEINDCPKVPLPQIDKSQNYLFISYSHRDYKEVYSDLAHLYTSGVRFWYDKGLTVGRDWEIEVEEHIHDPRCCGIIFYISTNMFLSDSIIKEIKFTQTRKNGVLIRQKNYFCVNLHSGNISRIHHDAQNIREANGDELLSTKVTSLLTSTFSDDDTYIVYDSKFHLDEMVEQIQRQFNVIGGEEKKSGEEDFLSVDTGSAAFRMIMDGKINIFKLCKYIYTGYKENRTAHEWYMIPIGLTLGIAVSAIMLIALYMAKDFPPILLMREHYSDYFIFGLAVFFCFTVTPATILQLFWLCYLSPAYRINDRHPKLSKIIRHISFIVFSVLAAELIPILYLLIITVLTALSEGGETYDRVVDIFESFGKLR